MFSMALLEVSRPCLCEETFDIKTVSELDDHTFGAEGELCRGLKTLQQTCDKNMKLSDQERNLCHLSEELK